MEKDFAILAGICCCYGALAAICCYAELEEEYHG